jgi:hypothetical protein
MAIVLKSGNLNHLETSGPVQACNGIALPLPLPLPLPLTLPLPLRFQGFRRLFCWFDSPLENYTV